MSTAATNAPPVAVSGGADFGGNAGFQRRRLVRPRGFQRRPGFALVRDITKPATEPMTKPMRRPLTLSTTSADWQARPSGVAISCVVSMTIGNASAPAISHGFLRDRGSSARAAPNGMNSRILRNVSPSSRMSLSDARPTREKSQPSAWAPPSNAPSRRGVNVARRDDPERDDDDPAEKRRRSEEPGRPVTDEKADHDRGGEAGQEPGKVGRQGRDPQHVISPVIRQAIACAYLFRTTVWK